MEEKKDSEVIQVGMDRYIRYGKMDVSFEAKQRELGDVRFDLKFGLGKFNYVPAFLIEWLNHFLFVNRDFITLERYRSGRTPCCDVSIFEFSYTMDLGIKPKGICKYNEVLIDQDIVPFLVGCGFTFESYDIDACIPEEYRDIKFSDVGKKLFLTNPNFEEVNSFERLVLVDCFCFSTEEADDIISNLENHGFYEMPKFISEQDCRFVRKILDTFEIKYTLQ